jgi:hypothetical protein
MGGRGTRWGLHLGHEELDGHPTPYVGKQQSFIFIFLTALGVELRACAFIT